jgi:hypothetical protein
MNGYLKLAQKDWVVYSQVHQKEKELQIVFCSSLIHLVSRAGIEPETYLVKGSCEVLSTVKPNNR